MPKLEFGETAHFDRSGSTEYLKLTSKGEQVHIRFLDSPMYSGKHFLKTEDGWEVPYCARIMEDKECEYCQKYWEIKEDQAQLGDRESLSAEDKKKYDNMEKEASGYKVSMAFYYPVLERKSEEVAILETTQSVRWKLDEEVKAGINVTEYDYILTRTEKPGSDYYKLTRLDSKQIEPLTEKEKKEVKRVGDWDISKLVYGNTSSFDMTGGDNKPEEEQIKEEEQVSEDVEPDEIPF